MDVPPLVSPARKLKFRMTLIYIGKNSIPKIPLPK
jgi:hypothetical protein